MAGIAIPDNLRPALTAIARYHFWILAALVPLLLVPLLMVGSSAIRERIVGQRKQIEAKLGQARAVTAVQSHPNEGWQAAIDADAQAVNAETLEEWRRFWHSQAGLRIWPSDLGAEFLDDVTTLAPDGRLDRQSLVRYQNMAPRLARTLPVLMGVEDAMGDANRDGQLPADARPGISPDRPLAPPLEWSPASQRRLYESFVWPRVPNTTQVLLAQEELWVYGALCRLVGDFVKSTGATGAHDSPLTVVEELAVGFPAGVEQDQTRQEARIWLPKTAAEESTEGGGMEMPAGGEGVPQTPWHPRFTSGGGGRGAPRPDGAAGGDQPAGTPDDDYRGWIYVDFAGKPLSAAELAAAPEMKMVHLMPFVLRVVIDQRQLDRLLAALAVADLPIDVRQIRVNPGVRVGQQGDIAGVEFRGDASSGTPGDQAGRRPHDIVVELRGSAALAVRPPATSAAPEVAP